MVLATRTSIVRVQDDFHDFVVVVDNERSSYLYYLDSSFPPWSGPIVQHPVQSDNYLHCFDYWSLIPSLFKSYIVAIMTLSKSRYITFSIIQCNHHDLAPKSRTVSAPPRAADRAGPTRRGELSGNTPG